MVLGTSEVHVDAGWIHPRGDLKVGFPDTPLGFGSDPGLEVGFGWRYGFGPAWSISPSFHFANFGDFNGEDGDGVGYRIQTTSYRYSLEVRRQFRADASGMKPFLATSAGIFRNRVTGVDKNLTDPLDTSLSTLGVTLQAGFRAGSLDFGIVYSLNRYASWRLFDSDQEQDYDWDTISVRMSWSIPAASD